MTIRLSQSLFLLAALFFVQAASAQSAWVSDEFEVTLRTGPSTSNAIELMISSGTELQILEEDPEAGYTRVRTGGGTEGWVLTRYLMDEPSAREQLETLSQQLTSVTAEGASMGTQLSAIRDEYDSAKRTITQLESDNAELQSQIEEISSKAANTLAIDRQNQELQQKLTDAEIQVNVLEQEKDRLSGQSNRNWFMTGSAVLFVGVLLGLILPRMKFQRRSRGYDRF
ncbi:MAG: TIGR04211 family SH3 domain-containing protein [Gammaproteobacteria bacterium]|nr:TIGR04211 family SH3 domain-containing protein [Gammaproteobacteria bacterium]